MQGHRSPRILVVDDVQEIRLIHSAFLDASGMEVSTAENGSMALDAVRRGVPDVIVTDLKMPVMDGLDLCRQIRAHAATRDIVVVAVTGDAPTHTQSALDAGCDVVLEKPISRTVLLTTIRALLERR
jgi:CheY-like chemotaxis protein